MNYDEFKQDFLSEFQKIKSFAGKIQYANQNLQRLGSGSGRIVYDIDGNKVFKLAKNAKGIAQNAAEGDTGKYYDTQNIVTIVYESADDDSWLIAEKGKKVTEKRIKELTGIPSLFELGRYLRNNADQNKGKRAILHQDKNIVEELNENEFVQNLSNFINNYSQHVGDMVRPSSYGEVLRDGQPTIVLTDYGLSDEVYSTHYDWQRKQRMSELYNFADGNDDILSDIGCVGDDQRHGMWALPLYGVDDNVTNEEHIKFISKHDKYPNKPLKSISYLTDMFHDCVNNLNEILNKAENKEQFYNNLLKLQEYLIENGCYDRDRLDSNINIQYKNEIINRKQNDLDNINIETQGQNDLDSVLEEGVERNVADKIANQIAAQMGYGQPKYLGSGFFGAAYDIGNNRVLKITSDKSEAVENLELKGKPLKHIAIPYNVFKINSKSNNKELYAIVLEKLKTDNNKIEKLKSRLSYVLVTIFGISFSDIVEYLKNGWGNIDIEGIEKYMSKNPKDADFYYGILDIIEELQQYGIESTDFTNPQNLGFKPDGSLGFFDVGFGDYYKEPTTAPEDVMVDEDGSAKFSTINSIGQDDFPAYDNNDTSPSIENDLNANRVNNSEDLEYNNTSDPTKDEYIIDERILSSMKGSSKVDVKKKCRLGGLGNTSAACNQGDIGNLNIKPLKETEINENILNEMSLRSIKFDNIVTPQYITVLKRSDGFDRYLEYFKYEYRLEDQDNEELEQHPNFENWFNEELYNRYDKALDDLFHHIKSDDTIDIWRKMKVNDKWLEQLPQSGKHLGIYWTWDERAAEAHWGHSGSNSILIKSSVHESHVNWHDTIILNMDIDLGEEEKEIRLFKNTPLKIEELYVNGENIIDTTNGEKLKNKTFLAEDIHPNSVLKNNQNAISTVLKGKRDIGFVVLDKNIFKKVEKFGFNILPVQMLTNNLMRIILYNPKAKDKAMRLFDIAKKNNGHLTDRTPEEAREIGRLLGYNELSIEGYIKKKYPDKIPFAPEPEDFDNLDEHSFSDFEKQIEKDEKTNSLDKKYIRSYKDENETVHVCSVNGDEVRDDGFIEFVEGGNHYVDYKEPINKQKYAKWIPEDEIWVDDVHLSKPNDMEAILLHERVERDLIKHFKYTYDNAHDIANKAEELLRKKIKNGAGVEQVEEISSLIHAAFKKKFKKESNKVEGLNEAELMKLNDLPFKQAIEQQNGKIYSVGGAVRDEFLGKESKDLDILISGIPMEKLEYILSKYGKVDAVGKSFGILKFKPKGSTEDIDIAIPRTEKATGEGGHKGFEINSDHNLPIEADLSRRDFTINAIAKDSEGNIIDPYNGQEDLKNKIIRVVNPEAFSDDPLRMLRAIQFASRFNFHIEPKTMQMIVDNAERIKEIPPERILIEFEKIINKGNKSTGAFLLKATGLRKQIFGNDSGIIIGNDIWDKAKTMGEFIFLLSHNIIDNPAEFFKNNLNGDLENYKLIKALDIAYQNSNDLNSIKTRSIAHNMFVISPQSLQSQILPDNIKNAAIELLDGKYPKTISELAVNGNDLMQAGLNGKEIGDKQKELLLNIYGDKIKNNKKDLLDQKRFQ